MDEMWLSVSQKRTWDLDGHCAELEPVGTVLRTDWPLLLVAFTEARLHSKQGTLPAGCCLLGGHCGEMLALRGSEQPLRDARTLEEPLHLRNISKKGTLSGFRILRDQKRCCLYPLSHHLTACLAHLISVYDRQCWKEVRLAQHAELEPDVEGSEHGFQHDDRTV